MAETIYTPDGKLHVLIGSTTLLEIVREYAGDEAADRLAGQLDYTNQKEQSDLSAYEADLDHLHRILQDCVDDLDSVVQNLRFDRRYTKDYAAHQIEMVKRAIEGEL